MTASRQIESPVDAHARIAAALFVLVLLTAAMLFTIHDGLNPTSVVPVPTGSAPMDPVVDACHECGHDCPETRSRYSDAR